MDVMMLHCRPVLAVLLVCLLGPAACVPPGTVDPGGMRVERTAALSRAHAFPTVYQVAEGLASQLVENVRDPGPGGFECVVTTLVDIDDLRRSSRFGRLLAEAMGAEIFRRGFTVVDIRPAGAFLVGEGNGEMLLSREASELRNEISADSALVGTYGVGASSVAVTVRLVDLSSHRVLSVAMAEMARTPAVEALLTENWGPVPTCYDRLQ